MGRIFFQQIKLIIYMEETGKCHDPAWVVTSLVFEIHKNLVTIAQVYSESNLWKHDYTK